VVGHLYCHRTDSPFALDKRERFCRCAKIGTMEASNPEPLPEPKKSRTLGFGVLVTIAFLGVNRGCSSVNASPSWIIGTAWFALSAACLVILIWLWDHTNRHNPIVRSALSLVVVGAIVASTYNPVREQYRKEHPSPSPTGVKIPPPPAPPSPVPPQTTPTLMVSPKPDPEAQLEFSFWPIGPDEHMIDTISKQLINGVVEVAITAKDVGTAQAENGQLWIQLCDACKFAEEPTGATMPPNDITVRRKRFDVLHMGSFFESTTLRIIPPEGILSFTIALKYSCEKCPPINNKNPKKLRVNIIAAEPTLLGLFKTDFSSIGGITDGGFNLPVTGGNSVHIDRRVLTDFPGKSKFLAFYISSSEYVFESCMALAGIARPMGMEWPVGVNTIGGDSASGMTSIKDLTFSGRVFIYHEWPLSNKQKADITETYAAKSLDVQFRGIDYLGMSIIRWHQDHDGKK